MTKLPTELSDKFDVIFYNKSEANVKFYHDLGFTPNGITTLSMITGFLSVFFLYNEMYILSGILLVCSYYYDCMDGTMARKYNMTSKFGDLYDHLKDISVSSCLMYFLYQQYKNTRHFYVLYIVLLTIFLSNINGGYQELYQNKSDFSILSFLTLFTPSKDKEDTINKLHITKYCGFGTSNMFIVLAIVLLKFIK